MVRFSKSREPKGSVGSNPTLSASGRTGCAQVEATVTMAALQLESEQFAGDVFAVTHRPDLFRDPPGPPALTLRPGPPTMAVWPQAPATKQLSSREQVVLPSLYETIRTWKEAQLALLKLPAAQQLQHQAMAERMLMRLSRYQNLADLAAAYYLDVSWWRPLLAEFSERPDLLDGELIRGAAHYQRLLQIRHPARP